MPGRCCAADALRAAVPQAERIARGNVTFSPQRGTRIIAAPRGA